MFPPRRIPPLGPPKANSRQRALAQWRGLDIKPLEISRAKTEKSVGSLLPEIVKGLKLERRQAEAEIVKVWNSLMDPVIAEHAQPAGINNGTLFVNVDTSVWLSEIVRYRRKEILDRMQHSFGKDLVKRISFRMG